MLSLFSALMPILFSVAATTMSVGRLPDPSLKNLPDLPVIGFSASDFKIYRDENTAALENLVRPWLLHFTNEYRKSHGLDTLVYDACLVKAAAYHSSYLFNESQLNQRFKLVHQQEEDSKWFKGKTPSDRAAAAGCQKYCGENALYMTVSCGAGIESSKEQQLNEFAKKLARAMVYEQWHESKPHRANMLSKDYKLFGVSAAIGKTTSPDKAQLQSDQPVQLVAFGVQVFAY